MIEILPYQEAWPSEFRAIADMKLTSQDALTIMQQQSISVSSSSQRQSSSGAPSGGGPAGGPPGDDPMEGIIGVSAPMGSQCQSSTQTAGGQSAQSQSTGADQIPPGLIEALIKLLEQKAAS